MGGGPSGPAAPTPERSSEEVQAAAERERRLRLNARGRAATVLTGGQGVQTPEGSMARRTLLGA